MLRKSVCFTMLLIMWSCGLKTAEHVPTATQTLIPLTDTSAPVITKTFTPGPTPTLSASYYSSPDGSGSVCNSSSPCSLATGISKLNAGDTLYLKSGKYLQPDTLEISNEGTQNSRITITRDQNSSGEAVISGDVNGNGIVDETDGPRVYGDGEYNALVHISGRFITLEGITIEFSAGRGLILSGSNNIISGNNIHHAWQAAVKVYSESNLIENNHIWRGAESNYCGGANGSRGCNGDWSAGLSIGSPHATEEDYPGPAAHTIVRGNIVYHNSGEGILCVHSDYITIENNVVYDNWGMGIDLDKSGHTKVISNLIFYTADRSWWRRGDSPHNGILISNEYIYSESAEYPLGESRIIANNMIIGTNAGIKFWPGEDTFLNGSRLINDLIINNTIVEPQNGVAIDINEPRLVSTIKDGEIVLERVDHENTVIANNIILYTKATIESDLANVVTTAGLDFHHNLWWASPYLGPPANVNDRDTDIIENPKLHDPDHIREGGLVNPNWYELSANSPAINAAKYFAEVTIDFYWNQRSNPPDMGAHEFGGNLPPTTPE